MASTNFTFIAEVANVPDYAKDAAYIVARYDCNKLWFYGAWDNEARAQEVADEVDGLVLRAKS